MDLDFSRVATNTIAAAGRAITKKVKTGVEPHLIDGSINRGSTPIFPVQTAMGWDDAGLPAVSWTLLKLSIAGAIGATVIARKGDIAYVLVIAWAAFGVMSKQVGTPAVAGAAMTLSLLAVLLAVVEVVRRLRA
jgi:hypothetical protein